MTGVKGGLGPKAVRGGGYNRRAAGLMHLETPPERAPRWRDFRAAFGAAPLANGLVGFLFAASGPVAIVLSVGSRAGLDEATLASWLFGAFFLNAWLTLWFSWRWRQPLVFFWTIPGTVLVGPALAHLAFAEVVGAFLATGALMLLLGASGAVGRALALVPLPVVMGMVAGVFLRFALDLVYALRDDLAIAAPMVLAFVAASAWPALGRRLPPLLAALAAGVAGVALRGLEPGAAGGAVFAQPQLVVPRLSWSALVELVVPLAITVLVVQNGQGIAVLRAAGHAPPANAIAAACGAGSLVTAWVGTVSTCLTGPTNAILCSAGERHTHWTGAVVVAVLALAFGLAAPLLTRLMLVAPPAFVAALAGLAMLRVLQNAFGVSFRDRFTLGALVAFVVTAADVPVYGIGAPFWALVVGTATARLLERADFAAAPPEGPPR